MEDEDPLEPEEDEEEDIEDEYMLDDHISPDLELDNSPPVPGMYMHLACGSDI